MGTGRTLEVYLVLCVSGLDVICKCFTLMSTPPAPRFHEGSQCRFMVVSFKYLGRGDRGVGTEKARPDPWGRVFDEGRKDESTYDRNGSGVSSVHLDPICAF